MLLLICYYFDFKKNLAKAILFVLLFYAIFFLGFLLVINFHIYFALLIPFLLFGMLIIKKVLDHKPNENETIDKLN